MKEVYNLVAPHDDAGADLDGDGVANLAEYALNLDPTIQDASLSRLAPSFSSDQSYMDVTYRESVLANAEQDASVALFGAENLFSVWQAISTPPISSSLIEEDTTRLITQQVSMAGKMSYFIKLQVATP